MLLLLLQSQNSSKMELLEESTAVATTTKSSFNIKREIGKYAKKWYWIVLSMILFYFAAKIYLRYIEPLYFTKSTLKFSESKSKGNTALSDLQTLGTGLSDNSELQSETTAIVSKPILTRVVENLNLNVSFFALGKILEPEIYKDKSLNGKLISYHDGFSSASYILTQINPNEYKLSEGPLLPGINKFRFGKVADLPFGKVVISKNDSSSNVRDLKVVFKSTESCVASLEGQINVSLPENKGLLMDLSIVSATPKKAEDILNEVSKQYNIEDVKDRNEEAQNTQNFITDRLAIISGDLSGIEGEKENFKKANEITDLDAQANMALSNSNSNTKQLVDLSTKLDLVNSIYSASNGEKLIPSNMGLSAQTEGYINEYNNLLLQKNKTLKQASSINPSVIDLNRQIADLKSLIKQNLVESKETLQIQIAQLKADLNLDKKRINDYPTQERVFRGIERQQTLKEQLYLYLLQKREENAITLAVTTPKARVLNPAYTTGIVKPNGKQILMGALVAGFALPLLIMYALNFLNSSIHSKEDILHQYPGANVAAEIPLAKDGNTLVQTSDFTFFAESYRILTSHLKYFLKSKQGQQQKVILVTSSVAKEGKTTTAVNTAITLASSKKVVLVGVDIRNPQLHRFTNKAKLGLTDYLIADGEEIDPYIVPFPFKEHQNLDIIFSGAVAPNPTDLLEMEKFSNMINNLKEMYDYVVLDSAPVMLVSDTIHVLKVADVVLYIVRADKTQKEMLDFSVEFAKVNHVKKLIYVLNSVSSEYSQYGKHYGKEYNSYYSDEQELSIVQKIKNKLFS